MRLMSILLCILLASCKAQQGSTTKVSLAKSSVMRSSVVALFIFDKSGKPSNCTGTIIGEEGFIMLLTASHCVQNAKAVYIVDTRREGEAYKQWQDRVLNDRKNATKVSVKFNDRYVATDPAIKRSGNDFAMGLIREEETNPELYKIYKENALTIGYDVDVRPSNLKNRINYIGAGKVGEGEQLGELREGKFNIEPKQSPSEKTVVIDACQRWLPCSKTRPGDSGSPLLYKDPNTNEKKVIGVLYGGRTRSESLYSNLAGNRFPDKIHGIMDELKCRPRK